MLSFYIERITGETRSPEEVLAQIQLLKQLNGKYATCTLDSLSFPEHDTRWATQRSDFDNVIQSERFWTGGEIPSSAKRTKRNSLDTITPWFS
jgi:hypothetical protein